MNLETTSRFDTLHKGFLGPSLNENQGLPSLGIRAARASGVEIDNTGKMRCPMNTPGAGRFTDIQQSNCAVPGPTDEEKSVGMKSYIEQKVGLFESRGRLGRAAQAVGSAALPGDSSRVRNPVRSAVARGLTPGKPGGLGRRLAAVDRIQCPAGFENGGQFTGRGLTNCGRQVFIPVNKPNIDNPLKPNTWLGRSLGNIADQLPGTEGGNGRGIGANTFDGRAIQIARNAIIPTLGGSKPSRVNRAIEQTSAAIRKDDKKSFMIRRDGVVLESNLSVGSLAKLKDNKDMLDGVLVVSGKSKNLGRNEIPALLDSPLKSVVFSLPNKKKAKLTMVRKPSAADKARLLRQWRKESGAVGLQRLAENSKGVFKFEYDGNAKHYEDVRIKPLGGGASRLVPLWVYNTYLQRGAAGREGRDIWVIVEDKK